MYSLSTGYSDHLQEAMNSFQVSVHVGQHAEELLDGVPNVPGVYVISAIAALHRPIYIGCSGKISRGLAVNAATMRRRLRGAKTPYKFDGDEFHFGPTSTGVPPSGYTSAFKVRDLKVTCLQTPANIAPAALEALLLQGCVHDFGDLPVANQKL
jgi:hypothetical protein